MSLVQEVEMLKRIPIFANIEPSKLKLLAFTSDRATFRAGEVLFHQNEIGDAAYIIIDGEAEVIIDTGAGPRTVATLRQNEIIGEIAILCDVPRTATIRARTDLVTLVIAKAQFLRMIRDFPQMAIEIMRELALRLERTTKEAARAFGEAKY
jgi:CRP/FNR family cyclic AMP-dependent transcriptional regulator